jgi:hypothetical protein
VDLSVQKSFKLHERFSLTLRGDALNAFNHQFVGAPGLNINNKNAAGVGLGGAPAPNTFGETWANTGTFRSIVVSGHITF